jgi:putative FmdB family regulatory protein
MSPVYEYRCRGCAAEVDRLLPHARATAPGPCETCGGELARRFSRVGVRLDAWGFAATDGLVADRPGRAPFRQLAERAERIAETGTP